MANNLKKYLLNEIYEGMRITDKSQLSGIYDKWIILIKKTESEDYIIGFIGDETNARSDALFNKNLLVCPIYNDSI